ncbi:muconolactone Delta-isomerase [Nocardioides sp. AN3]
MQMLVKLTAQLPETLCGDELAALFAAERDRAIELLSAGKMTRMWRIAGTSSGMTLWDVDSLEDLHDSLSSLPAWKYCTVEITPVVQHPVEAQFTSGAHK